MVIVTLLATTEVGGVKKFRVYKSLLQITKVVTQVVTSNNLIVVIWSECTIWS